LEEKLAGVKGEEDLQFAFFSSFQYIARDFLWDDNRVQGGAIWMPNPVYNLSGVCYLNGHTGFLLS
jgi:hypothetical protein